ncbi:hypothetical protein ACFVSU_08910 [Microbacterium sp. NPDC058062]|uniref:hypothetical protein n=1 Tax=Microbacterium sp. NPDC058062 TaxID=3346320 RepID=UPI0036D7E11E
MTQHSEVWAGEIHWTTPERGAWTADRSGRQVGEVKRDERGYVATRGRRTIGRYHSLDAALDAVDHRTWTRFEPGRFWTVLLATINVGILAAVSLIASVVFR